MTDLNSLQNFLPQFHSAIRTFRLEGLRTKQKLKIS